MPLFYHGDRGSTHGLRRFMKVSSQRVSEKPPRLQCGFRDVLVIISDVSCNVEFVGDNW
jgi:hypothetical protein